MLIQSDQSLLLVIDAQERLVPAIFEGFRLSANIVRLLTAARRLGVPSLATEQYPRGLGRTLPELAALIPPENVIEKIHFSCMSEPGFDAQLKAAGRKQLLVTGMEAHICILQSVLEMQQAGYDIFVVDDATGSRAPENDRLAKARISRAGIPIVSTEMVIFEWVRRADVECFKELSSLIK
jgi:nicotinamidase-related amidase